MKFIKIWKILILSLAAIFVVSGCATTSQVVVNPAESGLAFKTAYLVTHGGRSVDMDNSFRSALLQHGLTVTEGESPPQSKDTDIVVKYDDSWRWDLAMYLLSLDVQVYDGKTGALISESTWHNSPAHTWPDEKVVVAQLLQQTFTKLNAKTPLPLTYTRAPESTSKTLPHRREILRQ